MSMISETDGILSKVETLKERISRNKGKLDEHKRRKKEVLGQLKEAYGVSTLKAAESKLAKKKKRASEIKQELNGIISSIDQLTRKG